MILENLFCIYQMQMNFAITKAMNFKSHISGLKAHKQLFSKIEQQAEIQ